MPSGRDGRPDARLLDARTAQPTARPTPARAARESTSSRSAPPKALANPSRRAARSAPGRAACTARKTQVDDESATTTSRAASPDGHSASRARRVKRLGNGAPGTPRWSPTTGPDGQMYVTDGTRSQASSSPRRAHHPPEPKILRAARGPSGERPSGPGTSTTSDGTPALRRDSRTSPNVAVPGGSGPRPSATPIPSASDQAPVVSIEAS